MTFDTNVYLDHFGLHGRPFTLVPDPKFVFWSRQHRRAQAMLEYGLMSRAPVTMVVGEVGSGKTTLVRELLSRLGDELCVGFVANAAPTDRVDMLRLILHSLGLEVTDESSYSALYRQLEAFLVDQYSHGRRVVLIFDEAQNLGREALEHLRMLTNINFSDHELVQLVLVGQPELQDVITRSDMTQLAQRISASVYLKALQETDLADYIHHRLRSAGATTEIFEPETIPLIYDMTGGVPRLVNQVCDFSLLYAFVEERHTVSVETVQGVLDDNLFFCAGRKRPLRLVQTTDHGPAPDSTPDSTPGRDRDGRTQ